MNSLLTRVPMTRVRVFLARVLYRLVRLVVRDDRQVVTRRGVTYELDLSEGIDLSVFVFGNFQGHLSAIERLGFADDAVVIDVGANIGAMSLPFAMLYSRGRVYAFEPTDYAWAKLRRNCELNPLLSTRVESIQSFVGASDDATGLVAYASWRVGRQLDAEAHGVHCGTIKSAEGVGAVTLDRFCREHGVSRVDFVKIDTDGHELSVLEGARQILRECRPTVLFEVGLYVLAELDLDFLDYLALFEELDYVVYDIHGRHEIDASNFTSHIPQQSTTDLLARPR